MNKLYLENIQFSGMMNTTRRDLFETLKPFSYEFEFGKTYGIDGAIDGEIGVGAWALSWMIGGAIVPSQGSIALDDTQVGTKQLRDKSWLVSYAEIKRFGFVSQSVKAQVRSAAKRLMRKRFWKHFI